MGITPGKALNIVQRGGGIYIYPIEAVTTNIETENIYLKILEKTKGTWAGDDWGKLSEKRRGLELRASARRKKAW